MKEKPEYFLVKEVMKLKLGKGRYSVYLMKKRDYNTLDAVRAISRKLRVNEKRIGYAGNKDKRAVTKQYISILDGGKRNLELKDISLKYIGQIEDRIRLGGLDGNRFRIKVGKVRKCNFFVNYFGEQRFGRENWIVGKKLVKNEDVDETDKKKLRFMLHSYQSFLFNEVLRRFLKKYDYFEKNGYVFLKKRIRNFKIPLINFDTELKGEVGKVYKEILDEEGIKKEDFLIRQRPFLVSDTVYRDVIVNVKDFKYKDGWVEFFLPKGAYATVFLKKILEK